MQAGAPPCSSQSSTQRKSEVERSGGTLKQVPLVGEGVQRIGHAVATRGRRRRAVARRISVARETVTEPVTALVSQAVVDRLRSVPTPKEAVLQAGCLLQGQVKVAEW